MIFRCYILIFNSRDKKLDGTKFFDMSARIIPIVNIFISFFFEHANNSGGATFSVRLGTVTSTILNQIPLNVLRESCSLLERKVRVLYFEDEAALK